MLAVCKQNSRRWTTIDLSGHFRRKNQICLAHKLGLWAHLLVISIFRIIKGAKGRKNGYMISIIYRELQDRFNLANQLEKGSVLISGPNHSFVCPCRTFLAAFTWKRSVCRASTLRLGGMHILSLSMVLLHYWRLLASPKAKQWWERRIMKSAI